MVRVQTTYTSVSGNPCRVGNSAKAPHTPQNRVVTNAIARTYLNGNALLPWAPGQLVGQSSSGVGYGYSAYGRSYVAGVSYRF